MKDLILLNRVYPGKSNQVKRVILKHAVSCFYKYGIEATNIEMIKDRAKISVGTIYYHFKNKEGIVAHLVLAAIEDLFVYRQRYLLDAQNFQESIYALVLSYVDWVDEHPNFAQIMFSGKFDVYTSDYKNELNNKKLINRKKILDWFDLPENYYKTNDIPFDLFSSLINGPTEHYCKYWLLGRVEKSPKYFRKELAHATWISIKQYESL